MAFLNDGESKGIISVKRTKANHNTNLLEKLAVIRKKQMPRAPFLKRLK